MTDEINYSGPNRDYKPEIGDIVSTPDPIPQAARDGYYDITKLRERLEEIISRNEIIRHQADLELKAYPLRVDAGTKLAEAQGAVWGEDNIQKGYITYNQYREASSKSDRGSKYITSEYKNAIRGPSGTAAMDIRDMSTVLSTEAVYVRDFLNNYVGEMRDTAEHRIVELFMDWANIGLSHTARIESFFKVSPEQRRNKIPSGELSRLGESEAAQYQSFFMVKANTLNADLEDKMQSLKKDFFHNSDVFYSKFLGPTLGFRLNAGASMENRTGGVLGAFVNNAVESLNVNVSIGMADLMTRTSTFDRRMNELEQRIGVRENYVGYINQLAEVSGRLPNHFYDGEVEEQDLQYQEQNNTSNQFVSLHNSLAKRDSIDAHEQYILKAGDTITGDLKADDGVLIDNIDISSHVHTGKDSEQVSGMSLVPETLVTAMVDEDEIIAKPENIRLGSTETLSTVGLTSARLLWDTANEFFQHEVQIVPIIENFQKATCLTPTDKNVHKIIIDPANDVPFTLAEHDARSMTMDAGGRYLFILEPNTTDPNGKGGGIFRAEFYSNKKLKEITNFIHGIDLQTMSDGFTYNCHIVADDKHLYLITSPAKYMQGWPYEETRLYMSPLDEPDFQLIDKRITRYPNLPFYYGKNRIIINNTFTCNGKAMAIGNLYQPYHDVLLSFSPNGIEVHPFMPLDETLDSWDYRHFEGAELAMHTVDGQIALRAYVRDPVSDIINHSMVMIDPENMSTFKYFDIESAWDSWEWSEDLNLDMRGGVWTLHRSDGPQQYLGRFMANPISGEIELVEEYARTFQETGETKNVGGVEIPITDYVGGTEEFTLNWEYNNWNGDLGYTSFREYAYDKNHTMVFAPGYILTGDHPRDYTPYNDTLNPFYYLNPPKNLPYCQRFPDQDPPPSGEPMPFPPEIEYPDLWTFQPMYGVPVPGYNGGVSHIMANSSGSRFYVAVGSWIDRMDFNGDRNFTGRDGIWFYYPNGDPSEPQTSDPYTSDMAMDSSGRIFARNGGDLADVPSAKIFYTTAGVDALASHGSPAYQPWSSLAAGSYADVYPTTIDGHPILQNRSGRLMTRNYDGSIVMIIPTYKIFFDGYHESLGGIWNVTTSGVTNVHMFGTEVVGVRQIAHTIDGYIVWVSHEVDSGHYVNFWDGTTLTKHLMFTSSMGGLDIGVVPYPTGGVWVIDNDMHLDESEGTGFRASVWTINGKVKETISPWIASLTSGDSSDSIQSRMVYARYHNDTQWYLFYSRTFGV